MAKTLSPCPEGKYRHPVTNRCRKVGNESSPRKSSTKKTTPVRTPPAKRGSTSRRKPSPAASPERKKPASSKKSPVKRNSTSRRKSSPVKAAQPVSTASSRLLALSHILYAMPHTAIAMHYHDAKVEQVNLRRTVRDPRTIVLTKFDKSGKLVDKVEFAADNVDDILVGINANVIDADGFEQAAIGVRDGPKGEYSSGISAYKVYDSAHYHNTKKRSPVKRGSPKRSPQKIANDDRDDIVQRLRMDLQEFRKAAPRR